MMTSAVKQKMARGEVAVAVNLAGHNPDLLEPLAKWGATRNSSFNSAT